MSESIKVRKKDKHIFDMLQAEFTLKIGKKITQMELFSEIIEFARSRKDSFFGRLLNLPLSEKEIETLRRFQSDWDVVTEESEIDRILYGAETRVFS